MTIQPTLFIIQIDVTLDHLLTAHLVPAIFLFLVGEFSCRPFISIMCLILSLGFNGAAVGSCLANPHDLAPNFAGT
jgi:hypothetical protein